MDPNLTDVIKTVSLEAIKILGPAVVAAFTGYWAARLQYVSKLKELARSHEFNARRELFEYYKNRQTKLEESHRVLNEGLGSIIGVSAAVDVHAESGDSSKVAEAFAGIADIYLHMAPFDIDLTRRDMKAKGLDNTEEFKKLTEYHETSLGLKPSLGRGIEAIKDNAYILMEIDSFLVRCNQLLLGIQIEGLFSKYMKSA